MYSIYEIVFFGTLLLIVYILFDFIRNKTWHIIRRVIFNQDEQKELIITFEVKGEEQPSQTIEKCFSSLTGAFVE